MDSFAFLFVFPVLLFHEVSLSISLSLFLFFFGGVGGGQFFLKMHTERVWLLEAHDARRNINYIPEVEYPQSLRMSK